MSRSRKFKYGFQKGTGFFVPEFRLIDDSTNLVFGMSRTNPYKYSSIQKQRSLKLHTDFDGIALVKVKSSSIEFSFYPSTISSEVNKWDQLHDMLDQGFFKEKARRCMDRLQKFGFLQTEGDYVIFYDSLLNKYEPKEFTNDDVETINRNFILYDDEFTNDDDNEDDNEYLQINILQKWIILEVLSEQKNKCLPSVFEPVLNKKFRTTLCSGVQVCFDPKILLRTKPKADADADFMFLRMTIFQVENGKIDQFRSDNSKTFRIPSIELPKQYQLTMPNIVRSLNELNQLPKMKTRRQSKAVIQVKELKDYLPLNSEWKVVNPDTGKTLLGMSSQNPSSPILNQLRSIIESYGRIIHFTDLFDSRGCLIHENKSDIHFYIHKDRVGGDMNPAVRVGDMNPIARAHFYLERLKKFNLLDGRPMLVYALSFIGTNLSDYEYRNQRTAQYHNDVINDKPVDYFIIEWFEMDECLSSQIQIRRTGEEFRTAVCSGYQLCIDNQSCIHRTPVIDTSRKSYSVGNTYWKPSKPRSFSRLLIKYTTMRMVKEYMDKEEDGEVSKVTLDKMELNKLASIETTFKSVKQLLKSGQVNLIGG